MTSAIGLPDGRTLEMRQDMIDVTSDLPTLDEAWTYTDRAGHRHHYDAGYPTLERVVDETWWCEDCQDEHETRHLECPTCGETVTPGMRGPDTFRRFMPGRTEYLLDGMPITQDEARVIIDEARR